MIKFYFEVWFASIDKNATRQQATGRALHHDS